MKRSVLVKWCIFGAGYVAAATFALASARGRASASIAAMSPVDAGAQPLGDQRRWSMTLEVGLDQPEPDGGAQASLTSVSGTWSTTVTRSSADEYDVACKLDSPQLRGFGVDDATPAERASFAERLSHRFWVTYQPDGAATRVHFPRDMSEDVRNLLLIIATEAEIVRPPQASAQWTATERDGAGSYLAVYQDLGDTIAKRKIQYTMIEGAPNATDTTVFRIAASEARFTVGAGGSVDALRAYDATRVDPKVGSPITAVVRLNLEHPSAGSAPDLVGSLERAGASVESGPVGTQRPTQEQALARDDMRRIKGVSIDDLLAALRRGPADDAVRRQLEAAFRRRPSDIAAASSFARTAPGETSEAVLAALGAAGTPQSQETLCGIALDEHALAAARATAVSALVSTTRPTPATAAALLRLLGPSTEPAVAQHALYTIGVVARNMKTKYPEEGAQLEHVLTDRYATCQMPACVDDMNALGNLGTPAAIPSIERALGDRSAAVRAAGARALRLVTDPAADRLLAATLSQDADAGVRDAVVFAAKFRTIAPLVEALAHAVQADPSEAVRVDAIGVLAGHIDESALIEPAFVAAATKDPKPSVRRVARAALGARAGDIERDGG